MKNETNLKIEEIPFHSPKKRPEDERQNERPKRKEINLSELRKALEKSLEKEEDKTAEDNNKKGIIQPGEKVKF